MWIFFFLSRLFCWDSNLIPFSHDWHFTTELSLLPIMSESNWGQDYFKAVTLTPWANCPLSVGCFHGVGRAVESGWMEWVKGGVPLLVVDIRQ